ncbi:hypothetical protein [Desulforamulus profundi]|uniref:hypothetical protein n=1 Tax=Desulforamulus profundi TaxID=1383067 RepID=UPI001EE628A1|nr:hypothetical protein [Desulforamulus profundi]
MPNTEVHLARYITIAADLADRIVRGEYQEGQKVFGRSTWQGNIMFLRKPFDVL